LAALNFSHPEKGLSVLSSSFCKIFDGKFTGNFNQKAEKKKMKVGELKENRYLFSFSQLPKVGKATLLFMG
jgi:hypothetical protein